MKKLLLILLCLPMIGFGQDQCGKEPRYKGSKVGSFTESYEYKTYRTKLRDWIRCKDFSNSNSNSNLNLRYEPSIKKFFDESGTDGIEGIWEFSGGTSNYRLAVLKRDLSYRATILEGESSFIKIGDLKATFEPAASDEVLTVIWRSENYLTTKSIGIVKNNSLITMTIDGTECLMYKVYPKSKGDKFNSKSGEWAGNGSGVIIHKSGYIVTNYHVIEDASEIAVEFKYKNKLKEFNAKVIKVDKTNDLAIIKIDDAKFSNLSAIPYNFKTRSVDVGTEIFALGYPMALYRMGKDIKFTDGKVSSKTGVDGDITTYQISAPILPGNSGGPLFDTKGNLIGINSAGLAREGYESVGYSIKTSYLVNLIDVLPEKVYLPSNTQLASKPLTEQIKILSDYVVLIKVR